MGTCLHFITENQNNTHKCNTSTIIQAQTWNNQWKLLLDEGKKRSIVETGDDV